MKNILRRLVKNPIFQGFSLLLTGSALAQIISFLLSPLLTRLYNPTEFGINSVFTSLLLINSVFATLKLQLPISITNSNKEKTQIINLGFLTSGIFSLVLFILVLSFSNELITFFDVQYSGWLYVLPISTFLIGIYELLYNNLLGNREYKNMTVISTLKVVFQGGAQIILSLLNIGYMGLILGNLFSYIVVDLMLLRANKTFLEKPKFDEIKDTWQNNIDYPKYAFPADLLGMASRESITVILTYLFTASASGMYALANRLIGVPINLIANSLRQVYLKEASVEFHNKGTIKRSLRNSSFALFGVSVPIIIVIYWIGPLFFEIVFGSAWIEAGHYLQAMALYFFTRFTIVPLMSSMYVIGKTKFQISANFFVLLVLSLITLYFKLAGIQNPVLFLQVYSFGYTIVYLIIYFFMWINVLKLEKE